MQLNGYFSELLATRTNPYEIELELFVRKLFEKNTEWWFEFQKNDNIYEYDLVVNRYYFHGAKWKKEPIAYLEIEISEGWKNEYPSYWRDISYLARKIYEFNWHVEQFTDELKNNYDKTIYIVFNKSLTDCHCQEIEYIANNFQMKRRNLEGLNIYNDTYLTIPKTQKDMVIWGIDNSINKIAEFIESKSENVENKEYWLGTTHSTIINNYEQVSLFT